MSVIVKKDEKISVVASSLSESFSPDEFVSKFQELYPKDWGKVEKCYREHQRNTKPDKTHPMPEPTQYLKNALNVWQKSHKKHNKTQLAS